MAKSVPFLLIAVAGFGILAFQNCSKIEPEALPSMIDLQGSESCVAGKKLSIFLDDANQSYLGDVVAFRGNKTAAANYGYSSASAHPLMGPAPQGFEVQIFFYEGTDGLSLNFYANVDDGGSTDNQFALTLKTDGNNSQDRILLKDDPNDLFERTPTSGGFAYDGRFHYWSNTDGAVIGPFKGTDFKIIVEIDRAGDNNQARFFSAGGSHFILQNEFSEISSFIIRFKEDQVCN